MGRSEADRFWAKVDKTGPPPTHRPALGPCWLWTAGLRNGYGAFGMGSRTDGSRRKVYAHRQAWEWANGPIPADRELDHLCRVPRCVRPDHLEPVPHGINLKRGTGPAILAQRQRSKTRCPQGHPYDEANTYWYQGERQCRECMRQRSRQRRRDQRGYDVAPGWRGAADWQKSKTACPKGHVYDERNTGYTQAGFRRCNECNRERARRAYAARKGKADEPDASTVSGP